VFALTGGFKKMRREDNTLFALPGVFKKLWLFSKGWLLKAA